MESGFGFRGSHCEIHAYYSDGMNMMKSHKAADDISWGYLCSRLRQSIV